MLTNTFDSSFTVLLFIGSCCKMNRSKNDYHIQGRCRIPMKKIRLEEVLERTGIGGVDE